MAAYLLGSIPAAHLAGRVHGIDLRQHGSGNLGATNAWRVLGWKIGLPVYLFDSLKGALPVLYFPAMFAAVPAPHWGLAYGIASIAGHVKPIFLLGQGGGKGVATAGGAFAALAPLPLAVAFAVFAVVLLITRYVSLASLSAAIALPIALLVFGVPLTAPAFIASVIVAAFVFWTHRSNIGRLSRGEESRFRQSSPDGELGR